jgi:hypothetical protein
MLPRNISACIALVGVCLAGSAMAQRSAGGRGAGTGGAGSLPYGVDEKDSLKDFHAAMAVQATPEQVAEFQAVLKSTDAARSELDNLRRAGAGSTAQKFNESLENANALNRKFVEGFSSRQRDLLKEPARRLEKADSGLQEQYKRYGLALQAGSTTEVPSLLDALDKSLAEFSSEQLALGRDMGIPLASGQDVTFSLPAVKNTVQVGDRSVEVPVSAELSQTAIEGSQRKFQVISSSDLSDLQQNATEILRTQFNTTDCGEQLTVQQAMLAPAVPASLLTLHLHYERLSCIRPAGQSSPSEIAEGDGSVDLKILPTLDSGTLKLKTEFSRIDAQGMMGESIRSGDLGDDLRARVGQALLPIMRAAADLRTLPMALRPSVKLKSARFRDAGAAVLALTLEGEVELSNEQADALARQLNQTLAAQDAGSR